MELLIRLLIAHVITDFWMQPNIWIESKRNSGPYSKYFIYHIILTTLGAAIMTYDLDLWYVPLIIGVSHFLIDWWKSSMGSDRLVIFIIDQIAHISVILAVSLWVMGDDMLFRDMSGYMYDVPLLLYCLAYSLVIFPAGYLISKATKRWQREMRLGPERPDESLDKAGEWIGWLERVLVLSFILIGEFSAIGFLIAAKSILRFNSVMHSERKQSEYVLVGTLMSFSFAVIVGLACRYFIGIYGL